jgi:hypothetical protein
MVLGMNSPLLDALLDAPELPELIEQAQRAFAREQKLRQKLSLRCLLLAALSVGTAKPLIAKWMRQVQLDLVSWLML